VCIHSEDLEEECEWLKAALSNYGDLRKAALAVKEAKLERYRGLSDAGDSYGQYLLGKCYHSGYGVSCDRKKGLELWILSAEQGNAWGQNGLGGSYRWGWAVDTDIKRAVELYILSAEQGNMYSQCALGICYYNGDGVTQNRDLAKQWLTRSADQCWWNASSLLGIIERDEPYRI